MKYGFLFAKWNWLYLWKQSVLLWCIWRAVSFKLKFVRWVFFLSLPSHVWRTVLKGFGKYSWIQRLPFPSPPPSMSMHRVQCWSFGKYSRIQRFSLSLPSMHKRQCWRVLENTLEFRPPFPSLPCMEGIAEGFWKILLNSEAYFPFPSLSMHRGQCWSFWQIL